MAASGFRNILTVPEIFRLKSTAYKQYNNVIIAV